MTGNLFDFVPAHDCPRVRISKIFEVMLPLLLQPHPASPGNHYPQGRRAFRVDAERSHRSYLWYTEPTYIYCNCKIASLGSRQVEAKRMWAGLTQRVLGDNDVEQLARRVDRQTPKALGHLGRYSSMPLPPDG